METIFERVGALDILAPQEHALLVEPAGKPVAETTLPDLIAAQAARTPDSPAVRADDVELSYRDLNERANRLAGRLAELKDRLGLTMMFISHDLSVVEIVSDRVMVLYLGRIMEIGPTADVYERPRHPYTAALLSAAPGQAAQRRERIVLQGEIPSPSNPPSGCVFRTRCPFAEDVCARTEPLLADTGRQEVACHMHVAGSGHSQAVRRGAVAA